MKVMPYSPMMAITNTDQLPRGTGSKYLEVIDNGEGPFIAVAWHRAKTAANSKDKNHVLLEFAKRSK